MPEKNKALLLIPNSGGLADKLGNKKGRNLNPPMNEMEDEGEDEGHEDRALDEQAEAPQTGDILKRLEALEAKIDALTGARGGGRPPMG